MRFFINFKKCTLLKYKAVFLLVCITGCSLQTNTQIPSTIKSDKLVNQYCTQKTDSYQNQANEDLWDLVRNGFSDHIEQSNPRIDYYVQWFSQHPHFFKILLDRAKPYLYYIIQEVKKRKMPTELALVPVVESAFDPFAYSNGLASGLWQITHSTGNYYEIPKTWWFNGRRDIIIATNFALDFLLQLNKHFSNWNLSLAAYNAGKGSVRKAIRYNLKNDKPIDYWSLPLPKQTENYVPKLIAVAKIIKSPSLYNIKINPILNKPFFDIVKITGQIDLKKAASLAGIQFKELQQLNPGYNQWASDPNGPFRLLLPVDNADNFIKKLALIPCSQRISWIRYMVHNKDNLHTIAHTFNVGVDVIKKVNKLENDIIYVGDHLLIPQPINNNKALSKYQTVLAFMESESISHDPQQIRHYHTVIAGDSLWSIANKHKVSLAHLLKINKLESDRVIKPGNKVLTKIDQHGSEKHVYTVKLKDNLWKIAKQNNTSVDRLMEWNNFKSNQLLHVNQKILIWKDLSFKELSKQASKVNSIIRKVFYTVKNGESINAISHKFRVSANQIVYWNGLDSEYLKPRQQLTLFVDVTQAQ